MANYSEEKMEDLKQIFKYSCKNGFIDIAKQLVEEYNVNAGCKDNYAI